MGFDEKYRISPTLPFKCHRNVSVHCTFGVYCAFARIKQSALTDTALFSSLSHTLWCPPRFSIVPLRQLAVHWPLPTGAHWRVIGQNADEVQSQPVIMGDVSPGRALKASHKPWKCLGLTSSQSNYCFSFGGHFTAFWGIIMSLASYRHERINTRKTLLIESCPDDDLVNLEFLDEVRFNMFISSCIDPSRAHCSW